MNRQNKGKRTRSVKNQIRGIKRLLRRDDLNDDARKRAEKQLRKLERKSTELKVQEQEKKHQKRYRKVKFFEKKKVQRALHQCKQKLNDDGLTDAERKKLQHKVRQCHLDIQYIEFFPKTQKYVSLFIDADKLTPEIIEKRKELRESASKNAKRENVNMEDEDGFISSTVKVNGQRKSRGGIGEDDRCENSGSETIGSNVDVPEDDFFCVRSATSPASKDVFLRKEDDHDSDPEAKSVESKITNCELITIKEDDVCVTATQEKEEEKKKKTKKKKKKKKKKRKQDEIFDDTYKNSSSIIHSSKKRKEKSRERQRRKREKKKGGDSVE